MAHAKWIRMHELPWQAVENVIKSLGELDMLGCIYYVGPEDQSKDYVPQENLEHILFTKATKKYSDE